MHVVLAKKSGAGQLNFNSHRKVHTCAEMSAIDAPDASGETASQEQLANLKLRERSMKLLLALEGKEIAADCYGGYILRC